MPRLLLVDDNPSIHRIAESLLAPTDVELVCVDSAAEALDRIGRGERFDVALVDTAMPGMDGWTLLGRLRAMEETAQMPIALMAGVLDPVDPAKLARAPIQGFLKKPIELRELGDRVKALLVTPVPVGPSPFSTVPATPARDLVKRAEAGLPEFRPEPEPEFAPEPADSPAEVALAAVPQPEAEEDLLLLTAEDLWPEEVAPSVPEPEAPVSLVPDMRLELEELDLDSLQDLTEAPLAGAEPVFVVPMPEPVPTIESMTLPEEDEHLVTLSGLEDLDTLPSDFQFPPLPELEPVSFAAPVAAAVMVGTAAVGLVVVTEPAYTEPEPEPTAAPLGEGAVAAPAASGQSPAVPGQVGPVTPEQAQALLQALVADPVLVDALVKAVVARMGDQVIREIAWEVMPDLAGRLQR